MEANLPEVRAEELSQREATILALIGVLDKPYQGDLANGLGVVTNEQGSHSPDEVYSAASWLRSKRLVMIEDEETFKIRLTDEGRRYQAKDLPETTISRQIIQEGKPIPISDLSKTYGREFVDIAAAWWKRLGGEIVPTNGSRALWTTKVLEPHHIRTALGRFSKETELLTDVFDSSELDWMKQRPTLFERIKTKSRKFSLTKQGEQVLKSVSLTVHKVVLKQLVGKNFLLPNASEKYIAEFAPGLSSSYDSATYDDASYAEEIVIGELTEETIRSGAWRKPGARLQAYSLGTPVPRTFTGKPHPLVQIIEQARQIFLELGFEEIEEDFVQSAFWNMDALFIPQDHPAREMQDTFYLETPAAVPVPDDLVQRISKVHESGKGTGSRGWGNPLDPKESRRALLRTHTTVGTIKYLAQHPEGPIRVFSIGRVFRKETMDATHLPEFHQIEGIATEKGADFPMLLGILQEFYRRLGFEKLRWRPAYFPYTEPSMEVEVWTGSKWMELGGCGIFRPEVTLPFGVKTPVLAWGLGLERLAMLRLGLKDIRELYISDLEWLRRQPLL